MSPTDPPPGTEPQAGPPSSTYRLQLGPDLAFDDVRELVSRLRELGTSHLYLSPVLEAAPGSTHGYDTVDHGRLSSVLGGRAAFDRLVAAVARAGMGLVVDVVPNHMSIAVPSANRWWWDVLENGPTSRYAGHFDVTWESSPSRPVDAVLLPVLGDHYGVVLEAGDLVVERSDVGPVRGPVVRYFDHVFPLTPGSVGAADGSVDDWIRRLDGDADALHDVLEQQHYQLCHWRRAARDLDYRRFFDIDTLIGVRVEDPQVFSDTHDTILRLVRDGAVSGLRIDHPDGLADPTGYLRRLADEVPGTWTVVEKILEPGELLPDDWAVAGTTGYDFLHVVDGVFRAPEGVAEMTRWWHDDVDGASWEEVVQEAKHEILTTVLAADVSRVTDVAVQLCEQHRRHRDHTRHDVAHAIRATARAMPVYRTYVRPGAPVRPSDRQILGDVVAAAGKLDPDVDDHLWSFLASVLSGGQAGEDLADELVIRFQQLTGPAMAKSVEDTAFYRYLPVASANEVGGNPGEPVVDIDQFHRHNERIQREWPATMTALTTHDTKRSADVRSRLDALTGMPERWLAFVGRWTERCDARWRIEAHRPTSTMLLQAVVGAWPIDRDRLRRYLEKATKEAKSRTSWTDPDPAFDDAVGQLVDDLLSDTEFLADVEDVVDAVLVPGRHVSLAKALLHLTSPGVPDCYQGSELWDLSLVDPDNRRPVDHRLRAEVEARNRAAGGPDVDLAQDSIGRHKSWVTQQALRLRQRRPACFGAGDAGRYVPIDVGDGAIAFRRGEDVVIAITLSSGPYTLRWDPPAVSVDLPDGEWTDVLTGTTHRGPASFDGLALVERRTG